MILLRQHESDFEKEGILIHESLEYWINAAQDIQTIFSNDTQAALNYHAAQMIAGGITFQICKNCGTSFFGSGAGHGKIKKRAGARFCSDKCRWTHHNKVRQAIAGTPVQ